MTKVLAWNIQSGGGSRLAAVVDAIYGINPDIVVLSEFRNGNVGAKLLAKLESQGFRFQVNPSSAPNVNSVVIASKIPFQAKRTFPQLKDYSHRLIEVEFPQFSILGYYFPQKDAKRPVFEHLLDLSKSRITTPALWIGDLNTGKHGVDETGATFFCAEYLGMLEKAGHLDAWRAFHGDKREYSWFSAAKNGFRIDHAFVTPPLRKMLSKVEYLHDLRVQRISDHSALLVELNNG